MIVSRFWRTWRLHFRPLHPQLLLGISLAALLTLLAGCGSDYGGSQNHMHDMLSLTSAPQTLLIASHIGLYRSTDSGGSWNVVAGEGGQAMDGLMIYKFAQSPVDAKRVYVLAVPRPDDKAAAKDRPGIYLSDDSGATWKLATPVTSFPSQNVYTITAGNASAGQVFALVDSSGGRVLYVSDDAGAHWKQQPALPASDAAEVIGDPAHPGRLLLYSLSSGLYATDDAGAHWSGISDIQGGVSSLAFAGSDTVYAQGDFGVYASHDDAHSFTLVNKDYNFNALTASPADPKHVYALTGTAVFSSTDGGRTWKQSAATSQHPSTLAVDPANASVVYVSMSYPLGVEKSSDGGASWRQILP
ncbi:MAG TPA: hypothetical protein VF120_06840 [Ktedonobacterales bacterium]